MMDTFRTALAVLIVGLSCLKGCTASVAGDPLIELGYVAVLTVVFLGMRE